MNREIKFRGKRLDNGEWAYGYYNVYKCPEYGSIDHEIFGEDIVDVDPSSVGQFTGLKDKNGKEIYEGDVVSKCAWIDWKTNKSRKWDEPRPVAWDEDNASFSRELRNGLDIWGFSPGSGLEVVGNVHDNPELIKE